MVTMVMMTKSDDDDQRREVMNHKLHYGRCCAGDLGCPNPQTTRPEKKLKTSGYDTCRAKVTYDQKKKHS